ncbi:hypothetical protein H9L39_05650 [Fusarium oxysporum f. sp. albedinis]|nr:hypothetical protein H9L39_05650 [Fusarium oxysporum f. sp. albedinis]
MQALPCPISPLPLLPSTLGPLFRLLTEGDPPAGAPSGSGRGHPTRRPLLGPYCAPTTSPKGASPLSSLPPPSSSFSSFTITTKSFGLIPHPPQVHLHLLSAFSIPPFINISDFVFD